MTVFKQALIELIFLTVASVGVALAANAIRERKSIELTTDYFRRTPVMSPATSATRRSEPGAASLSQVPRNAAPTQSLPPAAESKAHPSTDPQKVAPSKPLEHEFQSITLEEVQKVHEDPQTRQGLNVFVDARDDEHFAEGRIPGAMQCFPYEAKRCLDHVKTAADGAEKVIVYCEGGDCEDSIFMCRQLVEAGVPMEAVFLFEGGWKQWSANGMPVETGK